MSEILPLELSFAVPLVVGSIAYRFGASPVQRDRFDNWCLTEEERVRKEIEKNVRQAIDGDLPPAASRRPAALSCSYCGTPVRIRAHSCSACGAPIDQQAVVAVDMPQARPERR